MNCFGKFWQWYEGGANNTFQNHFCQNIDKGCPVTAQDIVTAFACTNSSCNDLALELK